METIQNFILKCREKFKPFAPIQTGNTAGNGWTAGRLTDSVRRGSVFTTVLLTAYGIGCIGLAHAQTQVFGISLGTLIENILTVGFAAIAVIWVLIKRIDGVKDELQGVKEQFSDELQGVKEQFSDELQGVKEQFSDDLNSVKDMIFKNEMKNQKEHHELNLAVNKVLWYLEGAKGSQIPKPPNLTNDQEEDSKQDS